MKNTVFLGFNYNDKSIKTQFDKIRQKVQADTPIQCVIIDKRANKAAKDLWVDIQNEIANAALCVFDVSAFRPNVVLELGLALALKNNDQILLTFRTRKSSSKPPTWLLSDISHLQRYHYGMISQLESQVRQQIESSPYMKCLKDFRDRCTSQTAAPDKYVTNGLTVLKAIRDEGSKTDAQIKGLLQGSACRPTKMLQMLKATGLLHRQKGPYGRYYIDS